MTEGTITRWLKKVGDEVEVDEPLLEVSTDKVDTEVPSPVAGTLQEIKAEEDETVEVGAELCIIGEGAPAESGGGEQAQAPAEEERTQEQQPSQAPEDEGAGDEGAEAAEEAPEPEPAAEEREVEEERAEQQAPSEEKAQERQEPARQDRQESAAASGDGGTYVTPLVRKMAAEHGVDLSSIQGTGVGGRIRKQDVLAAAEEQKQGGAQPAASAKTEEPAAASAEPSPLRGKTEKMTRLRTTIAKRMVESLQTSAQLTTVVEVDVTGIARLRESAKAEFQAREGVKLSFMPFFAKATTDALKEHPALNAKIDTDKGEITYFDHENLAIAVDTEKGLLTPVIKEAGDLSVSGLAKKIADIADRTRNNKIGPDDLSGGTFTLTNTGSRGALFDTPIINQPQVAILGTGGVVKRPVVIDDPNLGETIAVRHMCYLALTYDHRLVDGADAARFLADVKERLESAQFEV